MEKYGNQQSSNKATAMSSARLSMCMRHSNMRSPVNDEATTKLETEMGPIEICHSHREEGRCHQSFVKEKIKI
jgi:hypothetical protein